MSKPKKSVLSTTGIRWIIEVFIIAVLLSAALSFLSSKILEINSLIVAFIVLVVFIFLGIFFDIVGVAVTACDPKPFHSMAAHKEKGAKKALELLRNSDKVASICNDVVGDICGIVSGATAAVIVNRICQDTSTQNVLVSLLVTAVISGLTIGGKAMGKGIAINSSKEVIHFVARFLSLFSKE